MSEINEANNSNLIAIITLVITNITAIGVAILSYSLNVENSKKNRKSKALHLLLNEFYNPIIASLEENSVFYKELGPRSFPNYSIAKMNIAGEIWDTVKKDVIINNLSKVRRIIENNKNYIDSLDTKKTYNDLLFHCIMFPLYDSNPSEIYRKYKFKIEWTRVIKSDRDSIQKEIANE